MLISVGIGDWLVKNCGAVTLPKTLTEPRFLSVLSSGQSVFFGDSTSVLISTDFCSRETLYLGDRFFFGMVVR